MRHHILWLPAALLFIALLLVGGCQLGANLSGGSIPIGGEILGQLAQPASTTTSLADLPVDLIDASGEVASSTTTDEEGRFAFSKVPEGDWRIRVQQGNTVSELPVSIDKHDSVDVSLFIHQTITPMQKLQLQPAGPEITLKVGNTLAFSVTGISTSNASVKLDTSWIVHGNAGAISTKGVFTAKRAGTAVVTATYGEVKASVRITVLSPSAVTPTSTPTNSTTDR